MYAKVWRLSLGWLIFALGAGFYSYEYLLRVLPGTMTANLMTLHHLTPAALGWFSSCYYLTYTLMQIPVGLLLDRFNPKYVLLAAILICIIGNSAFASSSFMVAMIGRVLVGLGSAFAFVGVLRLATHWLPINQFALATGLVTTVGMLGGMYGDTHISAIVVHLGAQSAIHAASLLGLPIFIALCFIPRTATTGAALLDTADKTMSSNLTSMTGLFTQQLRGLLVVAQSPWLWINALIGCLLYIPLSAFAELWGIPFLQATQGVSPVQAGMAVSFLMLGWAVGAPFVGKLADKSQKPLLILALGSVLALAAILMLIGVTFGAVWCLNLMLLTFGIASSGQILVMVLAKSRVIASQQATAMAFTNMLIMLGGMVFQPLIGEVLTKQGRLVDGVMVYSAQAYVHAMLVVPVVLVLGLLLVIVLKQLSFISPSLQKGAGARAEVT